MLQGITEKGELKNVIVTEDGAIKTASGGTDIIKSTVENLNLDENGTVKVAVEGFVEQISDKEVVLNSSVLIIGTEAKTVELNKKITNIMIANYSETADITINTGTSELQVGANLALELPINLEIANLSITSTETDTKVQLVVKGVE